jgi:hypothetical protein
MKIKIICPNGPLLTPHNHPTTHIHRGDLPAAARQVTKVYPPGKCLQQHKQFNWSNIRVDTK